MEILFGDNQSKFYLTCVYIMNSIINPLSIFFYIPISELILLTLKCKNGKIDFVIDGIECYANLHYLYFILGIIGSILLLICTFFLLNFYFSPFQYYSSTLRITPINDIQTKGQVILLFYNNVNNIPK